MESCGIQHDFLFASEDVARDVPPCFDSPSSRREESAPIPVKASSLMGLDGEKMLNAFARTGKSIVLIDDLPTTDNPIVLGHRSLLIKGIVAEFHNRGNKVFRREKAKG